MKQITLSALLLLFVGAMTFAQEATQTMTVDAAAREASAIATQSLATLGGLVNEGNAKSLGFDSPSQVKDATPAAPLRVYLVQLDELRKYAAGADSNTLLRSLDQFIVPVSIGGAVRSSVFIEKGSNGWVANGFGSPNLARSIARARDVARSNNAQPEDAFFVVHVAALNRYFIGSRNAAELQLTALEADPSIELAADQTLPANEVFLRLVPIAQQYNGLPL